MGLNEEQKKERSEYLEKYLDITECSQKKPYVFISYASDNWETVFKTAIVPMQKRYGLRVYADKAFDKVNDKWIVPMLRNIRGADVVVAFVSQSYIESYACFLELLTAVNNKKQIVFVSLEEQLHLGNTTDQPEVERGVKNEILNQGANIATNTNNTSNDIMRAMKSAYTSISTLLEQDALSKYDISDAFINFFRDASINRKTINDLRAVKRTIGSLSTRVFDKSLITMPEEPAAPGNRARQPKPARPAEPVRPEEPARPMEPAQPEEPARPEEPAWPEEPAQPEPVRQAEPAQPEPAKPEPEEPAAFIWQSEGKDRKGFGAEKSAGSDGGSGKKSKKKLVIGVAAAVLVLLLILVLGASSNKVKGKEYTTPEGKTGVYTGEWKDNAPNGEGAMEWESGSTYEGGWKDGLPDGQGKETLSDGSYYEGTFIKNVFEGKGVYNGADGVIFDGEWMNNHFASGTKTCANGDVYKGTWDIDANRFSEGTVTYASGDVFEGIWDVDADCFSEGTATYANGDVYKGTWDVDAGFFSKGTIEYANGDFYEGDFADGYRNGQGKMTYADGGSYEGTWVNGFFNGEGTLIAANGTTHTGVWENGNYDGQGTVTYPNGGSYSGEWVKGNWSQGKVTYADGDVLEGTWDANTLKLIEGSRKYTNGDVAEGTWDVNSGNFLKGTVTMKLSDGRIYSGEWENGKANGYGTLTRTDGTTLTGQWKDGNYVT